METVYKISEVPKKRFMLKRYAVGLKDGKFLYSAYVNDIGTAKLYRVAGLKNDKYNKMVKSLVPFAHGSSEEATVVARVKAKLSGERLYQKIAKEAVEAKGTVLDEAVPVVKEKIVIDTEADPSLVKTELKKCPICGMVGKRKLCKCSVSVKRKLADAKKFKTLDEAYEGFKGREVAITEGTLVEMGDGSTKKVEDIRPGHLLKTLGKALESRVVEVSLKEAVDEEDEERWKEDGEKPLEDIVAVCNNPVNLKGLFEKGIEYFYKGEHPLNNSLIYVEDGEGKRVLVNRNQFSLR